MLKEKYDVVIIDSSPALNEETLGVILASDGLIIVATPDYPTMRMTVKAIKIAKRRGTPIMGMILNKVHDGNFEMSVDDIEAMTDIPIMAVIPHDIDVLKSLSEFTPSTRYKPKSNASIEYKKLAATLIGEKYKPRRFKDFLNHRKPKRHEINREIYYERVFR
jgi:septum site-determining protein MinD